MAHWQRVGYPLDHQHLTLSDVEACLKLWLKNRELNGLCLALMSTLPLRPLPPPRESPFPSWKINENRCEFQLCFRTFSHLPHLTSCFPHFRSVWTMTNYLHVCARVYFSFGYKNYYLPINFALSVARDLIKKLTHCVFLIIQLLWLFALAAVSPFFGPHL